MTFMRKEQSKLKKAKAFELFDEGLSLSAVADRLAVKHRTCRLWLAIWRKIKGENNDADNA